ncbi:flagellar basal body-associated protein FliL [Ornithinibacillus sp. 4-3]|uniref:Flagellar protein FliL n=1 Tax=Ornithinibacillus sp. 4-3 TaxID=3231488 RepID=A0AB39HUX7_9BACI
MSKMVKMMITSLVIILALGAATILFILNLNNKDDKSSAETLDEMVKYAYESPEITTDLLDGSFVRIQFQIITDGKAAQEEISKRDFQLKNILIKELAKLDEEDFKTALGELEEKIKDRLNELMTEGKIIDVYTINKILQ